MANEKEQEPIQAPDISGEEMKMPEGVTKPVETTHSTTPLNGILIVILVLLLVFILGGLYLWFNKLMMENAAPTTPPVPAVERPSAAQNNEPESAGAQAAVETQSALSTSDEIDAIEADIEATNLDSLDAELNAIDAELEAALIE